MTITTAQIRGARGILNWSQHDLSERTGISATSIGSIENGASIPRENTLNAIKKAFEDSGIEFMPNQGIRVQSGDVQIFRGRSGFLDFMNDVYETLKNSINRSAYVSNVNEDDFLKWMGDASIDHLKKIEKLDKLSYQILVQDGDSYLPATGYAEYRFMPKEQFSSVPFYVYGDKLAILLFEVEPTVIIINYPVVAKAYKLQFEALWAVANQVKK